MNRKTKAAIFALGAIVAVALAAIIPIKARASVSSVEIAAIPWDESNIAALRSGDVQQFVNRVLCGNESNCGVNVDKVQWADFEGNGKYLLVYTFDAGRRAQGLTIWENASGKISRQLDLAGGADEDLEYEILDLNGDGKKELVVYRWFGLGRSMAESPLARFPVVYRLKDRDFVEASREFPGFYNKEVLPPLEEKISALQKKVDSEGEAVASGEALIRQYHWYKPDIDSHTSPEQATAVADSERLALLQSLRDHIQHALGRPPTAEEEKEAREWLKSSDERLVRYAEEEFEEMGGHEAEVRAAQQTLHQGNIDFRNYAEEKRKSSPAPAPPPAATGNSNGTVN
jgi:hypothetical protein